MRLQSRSGCWRRASERSFEPPPAQPPELSPNPGDGFPRRRNDDRVVPTTAKQNRLAPVPHLTVAEKEARGKAARAEVPRSSHADFDPAPDRPDPIDLLEAQAQTRVPELVPIRYGRMLVSPFTFYRGSAKPMAHDLAG